MPLFRFYLRSHRRRKWSRKILGSALIHVATVDSVAATAGEANVRHDDDDDDAPHVLILWE